MNLLKNLFVFLLLVVFSSVSCNTQDKKNLDNRNNSKFEIMKSEEDWKSILSPEEYKVLRNKGTEYPGTGEYNLFFEKGTYKCRACGNILFTSDAKFESHCGWPSFSDVVRTDAIKEIADSSLGMVRTEVVCAKCGGHLGHLFPDGPQPTGLRYCINSVSINFSKSDTNSKENK